jgi:hypothetical protein
VDFASSVNDGLIGEVNPCIEECLGNYVEGLQRFDRNLAVLGILHPGESVHLRVVSLLGAGREHLKWTSISIILHYTVAELFMEDVEGDVSCNINLGNSLTRGTLHIAKSFAEFDITSRFSLLECRSNAFKVYGDKYVREEQKTVTCSNKNTTGNFCEGGLLLYFLLETVAELPKIQFFRRVYSFLIGRIARIGFSLFHGV